jgi:SagB-type dehydrogenase family enzyme
MADDLRRLLPRVSDSLAELYHHNTKLIAIGATSPPPLGGPDGSGPVAGARYPRHASIPLPSPGDLQPTGRSVEDVITARRTPTEFTADVLDVADLAALLHFGYGPTGSLRIATGLRLLRGVPSAGALHPLELFVAVRAVRGLAPALYHYAAGDCALALLVPGDPTQALCEACAGQALPPTAAATVVIAACLPRTTMKYSDRGYRYVLLEAGHLAQNLCLVATARGLGALPLGGFIDDAANAMFRLDGVTEAVLYAVCVGHTPH